MKYLKRCNHRIRAACFDLDGTLIDERSGLVPPDAQSAIKQIKGERKIYFATGRNLAEIPKQILELPFNGFVLLSGLVTYIKPDVSTASSLKNKDEFQGFKKLNAFPIEWEKVESVLAWIQKTGLSAIFYLLDQIFILSSDKKIEQVGLNPNWGEIYHFTDYQSFISIKPEVYRLELLIPKGCSEDVLKSFDRDEVTELEGKMYSLKKKATKREGMIPILREDWIPRQSLLYVGNSSNDLTMLNYVGYSCVMSDATDQELLKDRDYIAPPVEKGGITKCLKHFKLI